MSMDKLEKSIERPEDIPDLGSITKASGLVDRIAKDPWIHRSESRLCKTCMFYIAKLSTAPTLGPITGIGRCRRHAPVVNRGYPVVYSTDWCGDHKLDENRV